MKLFIGTVNTSLGSYTPIAVTASSLQEAEGLCLTFGNFSISAQSYTLSKPQVIQVNPTDSKYYVDLKRSLGNKLLAHARNTNRTHQKLIEDILTEYAISNNLY